MPTTLTDTHRVILAAAAARDDGAIFPLPTTLNIAGAARDQMLLGLRDRGLLLETPCPIGATPWRREEDGLTFALHIADAGLRAIGIETGTQVAAADNTSPDASALSSSAGMMPASTAALVAGNGAPPRPTGTPVPDGLAAPAVAIGVPVTSKQDAILTLLRQGDGSTINDLMAATGWQAHSVRGFVSGTIKKKLGLDVQSEKRDGERRYFLRPAQDGAIND